MKNITQRISFVQNVFLKYYTKRAIHCSGTMHVLPKYYDLDPEIFHLVLSKEIVTLKNIFHKHNFDLKIAGGAVRDLLMNKHPHDIDMATNALPNQMQDMFNYENIRILNLNGIKHGTVPVRINDNANFEITTLRIDVKTYGRHAEVEFTNDWHADAIRRDFTVNSLFLDFNGKVIDYVDGVEDLKNKRLRFVGIPDKRVKEDYLRILRYFRFFSRICDDPNSHHAESLQAIKDNVQGLEKISGERIADELRKISSQKFSDSFVKIFYEFNMAKYIGLPPDADYMDYASVYKNSFCNNLKPLSLFASLLKNKSDLENMRNRLKLSKEEYGRLNALFMFRDEISSYASNEKALIEAARRHLAQPKTKNYESMNKSELAELLRFTNSNVHLVNSLDKLNVPDFHQILTGNDIMNRKVQYDRNEPAVTLRDFTVSNHCKIKLNSLVDDLRKIWIEKNFQVNRDDLLLQVENYDFIKNYLVLLKNSKFKI